MNKKKIVKSMLIIIFICIFNLFFMNYSSLAATTGKINVETARLRREANVDSEVVELISLNEEVEILQQTGEWYQIKYKEFTGYLRKDLIKVNENSDENVTDTSSTSVENQVTENQPNAQNLENTENVNPTEASTEQNTEGTENQENNQVENEVPTDMYGKKKIVENTKLKIVPAINATDIVEVKTDEEVTVTEVINGWACVETSTTKGWIRQDKLKEVEEVQQEEQQPQEPVQPQPEVKIKTQYVNSTTVNLRKEANTSSEIVTTIGINTPVDVYAEENGWSKVKINDKEGYISTALLSDSRQETNRSMLPRKEEESTASSGKTTKEANSTSTESASTNVASSGKGATVIETAKQYLGYKYVYGGSSPSTGFDCSGFTSYVFKLHGVSLSRTAAGQYSNGTAVQKSNLQPGDLLMFGKSGINHVGIYLGGGMMIHAANPSRGVTTDTINSGYYFNNYVGARRVI